MSPGVIDTQGARGQQAAQPLRAPQPGRLPYRLQCRLPPPDSSPEAWEEASLLDSPSRLVPTDFSAWVD